MARLNNPASKSSHPCKKCSLYNSSYCIGCDYVRYGLNLSSSELVELKVILDKRSSLNGSN